MSDFEIVTRPAAIVASDSQQRYPAEPGVLMSSHVGKFRNSVSATCDSIRHASFGRLLRDRRLGDFLSDDAIAAYSPLEMGVAAALALCENGFTIDDAVIGVSIIVFFEEATADYLLDGDKKDCLEAFKTLIVASANVDQIRIWAIEWFPTLDQIA